MPALTGESSSMILKYFTGAAMTPHPALRLAARELSGCLAKACAGARLVATRSFEQADVALGTFGGLAGRLPDLPADDPLRDEVVVRSRGRQLILAGSNPRSVLYAVYTYLDRLGFAWVVPGPEGEIVPRLRRVPTRGYAIRHQAALIHRGFALAGAYSVEQGEAFIAWMARNRFNHFFLEGATARPWFEKVAGPQPAARIRAWDRRIDRAVKDRGMILERMGHGWTRWALGVAPGKPTPRTFRLTADRRRLLARNGDGTIRRSFHAQLCLSQPASHAAMADRVCRYAKAHPEIDVLGVWMADGFNNWCECPKCARVHPSDLWVRLINRLARDVYRVRPDLKIEVLGYSSLMEPPHTAVDNSRGNVILMYAPFLRCYLHRLDDPRCVSDQPLRTFPPANRLHHPMNGEFFGFFKGWREQFSGVNYVFDYYHWLPIKRDIFEGNVPEAICGDLTSYPAHGITGCVDCSRAQSFWPTPLGRWLQARASWDSTTDYPAERRRLLTLTFGRHAPLADRYLKLAYACLLPERHGREEERGFSAAGVRRFKKALPGLRRALSGAAAAGAGPRRKFLKRLEAHAEFTDRHVDQLVAEAAGRWDEARRATEAMFAVARRKRRVLEGVADWPEFEWLRRDTLKRLDRKAAGTYRRID